MALKKGKSMAKIEVLLRGVESEVEMDEGEILLDGLLKAGLKYPHGCRAGSCGACRTLVLEGAENLLEGGVIEKITLDGVMLAHPEPLPAGSSPRLACRAKVNGPCKITPL